MSIHYHYIWITLLGWPGGIILGNLLASLIWGLPAILHLDRLAKKHHRQIVALQKMQHSEHMGVLAKHHKEMKEWVLKSSKGETNTS
jgi:hypothetical protein